MFDRFRERSCELEHLDRGDFTDEEYRGCLVELRRINRLLGDARALRRSLLREMEKAGLGTVSVLDVGAGSGELLRTVARWCRGNGRRSHLVGVEIEGRAARAILEESAPFEGISAIIGDALRLPFSDGSFDYSICSLLTHHFRDDSVVGLLGELRRVSRRRVFVIDLHRHVVAYYLFTTLGRLFLHNRLIREDGALSIRRSFRPVELRRLAERAGWREISVDRRFPFRLVLSGD